ncbi:MAG: hypothetical protein HON70_33865 [Lentisphaerae bacterium]|nr:hypothetical protein [Lentisphaerota bacterium]
MTRIAILGASTYWSPMVCTNLMSRFAEPLEFRLIDINPRALELVSQWGEAANRHFGRQDAYPTFLDRGAGLQGADAVIITISTGGLEMMKADLEIPEAYGIFATVGDTAGPAGWSRSIRNIPVFAAFARDFERCCPHALIANYTNPMSSLTATIQQCCKNPTVGLCHSYLQTIERIRFLLDLDDTSGIAVKIAGMNHFHWVVDFSVNGQDGYPMLRERIGAGSIADLMPTNDLDSQGKVSIYFGSGLMVELFDTYGFLPYCGDRHTAEFLPFTLSGYPDRYKKDNNKGAHHDTVRYCNLYRTTYADRADPYARREGQMLDMIRGNADMRKMPGEAEPAEEAGIIRAYLTNGQFVDAVNHLNVGQIPQLPPGACVETLGVIDGLGVHPCVVPDIPAHLVELMRPQADCQAWLV